MNAMQHYRAAEQILNETGRDMDDWAQAQVHATLALAAVQAMTGTWRDDTTQQWRDTFDSPTPETTP